MKLKHLLSSLLLAGVLSFGVFAFFGHSDFVETKAAYSQGDVVDKDKARIWIGYDTNNPFYSYADADTGIRLWIHSTSSGGSENVYGRITGTFNNSAEGNKRYDYFDVDISNYTNQWYMTVQKFQNNAWKGQTNPIQLKASNAFQVYYVWGDWAWDQTQGTVSPGTIDSVDAGLAAKALGGIHTCSDSAVNGYKAFASYDSTFVHNGDAWKTVGNISDYELNDFANGDTSYSGSKTKVINAYDKYTAVQALYGSNGASLGKINSEIISNNAPMTAAVITLSVASITAIGGYFFLRKRKQD